MPSATKGDQLCLLSDYCKLLQAKPGSSITDPGPIHELACRGDACVVQQFSGINTIMFYAAELFQVLGSGQNSSLLNTVIIGAVNVASTVVAIVMVDRFGRKLLFIEGGTQMLVCFIAVAAIMGASFNTQTGHIANGPAAAIIVFECLFTAGFAWSWGPLGWLVPSEVHSIETRSLGMSIATCSNFLFSFIIGQW